MTVAEFVHAISPDTPLLLLLGSAFLVVAWFVLRKLVRAISDTRLDGRASEARLTGSIGRIGARTGRLERQLQLSEFRRLQVEACLRRQGFSLPPWPGDQDAYDDYDAGRDDEDRADDRAEDRAEDRAPRTSLVESTPPVPVPSRHRR